jgi:hypothetical protein
MQLLPADLGEVTLKRRSHTGTFAERPATLMPLSDAVHCSLSLNIPWKVLLGSSGLTGSLYSKNK